SATVVSNSSGTVLLGNATRANGSLNSSTTFTAINTSAAFTNASAGVQTINLTNVLRDTINYTLAGGSSIVNAVGATITAITPTPQSNATVPATIGLVGSLETALGSNSTLTVAQVSEAVLTIRYVMVNESLERSLPASEGATGRGDSVNIPLTRNGEFNVPVGSLSSSSFKPISVNTQVGGRAGTCLDSGVKLPPGLDDVETCR
ncbi:MAG: hypothetical protein RIT15_950, partial [Pseudomonadota bacterium]